MPVAEILGVVGSIIAIVQISKTVISLCQFYIDAAAGASSDLRVILIEVSTLKGIAESLQYLTQPNVANSDLMNQLAVVTGPIEGCKKALKELEALLPPEPASKKGRGSKRRKLDVTAATLAWPLKTGKAKKLLQEIIQHKTTINLALTSEFVRDVKDVKQKTEQIHNLFTEIKRTEICKWLETTNPSDIHSHSQKFYEPGTCSWMFRTPEWPLWIEGEYRCLWIHGIPGAGKSILASYLAEEIQKFCTSSSNNHLKLGYAYYYCYFGHNQDDSSHFLRWIIGQLCRQSTNVPQELQDTHKSGRLPTFLSLLSILQSTLEEFRRVYIVLDAVDESIPRDELLRVIRDLTTDVRFSNLSLLVTSREYIDIEQVLEACSVPIDMSNSFVEEDIRTLVYSTIHSDAKFQRWSEELRREMLDVIPKKAKGMFRWAVCQLDALRRLRPDASIIRGALSNLPKTLDETYDRIFLTIPEEDWLSVQHAFHWMAYHNDLRDDDIALTTLIQAVQQSTADKLHDFEGLRESCGCLIMVVQKHSTTGVSYNTVSFAHYTVKEYLQSPRISRKETGFFALLQERIQNHFGVIVLRQALAIQPGDFEKYETFEFEESVTLDMDANFKIYCTFSSSMQLQKWPQTIASDRPFMELCEAFVNPHTPAYRDVCYFLDRLYTGSRYAYDPAYPYYRITWHLSAHSNAAIFLNFLMLAGDNDIPHLALAFAKNHSMLDILTQELRITTDSEDDGEIIEDGYELIGSIPELVAQLLIPASHVFDKAVFDKTLDLIPRLGVNHFHLSRLLLLYIGGHDDRDVCGELCPLGKLLRLGASANGLKGACVTPLQIATANWDKAGVETLLKAGAMPGALGTHGLKWLPKSPMARFNHLHGEVPLQIIKKFDRPRTSDVGMSSRRNTKTVDEIKRLLLQYGAVDESGSSIPGSDHVLAEDDSSATDDSDVD